MSSSRSMTLSMVSIQRASAVSTTFGLPFAESVPTLKGLVLTARPAAIYMLSGYLADRDVPSVYGQGAIMAIGANPANAAISRRFRSPVLA
ncbi:MAG: hypothetical protein M9909_00525 [Thermomicrobiales bacterium]|nr:hypothetical protein [Thermomicrobiales bacterium]